MAVASGLPMSDPMPSLAAAITVGRVLCSIHGATKGLEDAFRVVWGAETAEGGEARGTDRAGENVVGGRRFRWEVRDVPVEASEGSRREVWEKAYQLVGWHDRGVGLDDAEAREGGKVRKESSEGWKALQIDVNQCKTRKTGTRGAGREGGEAGG